MRIKKIAKIFLFRVMNYSINRSCKEQKLTEMKLKLAKIIPDLSEQYTSFNVEGEYLINKVRSQHAFQITLAQDAIKLLTSKKKHPTIVDIGDSSGAHLKYLNTLIGKENIRTLSVNFDPIAVKKIRQKGLEVVESRAELLHKHPDFDGQADIFLSYEMIEHLIDPIGFLYKMSTKSQCNYFVITVPYLNRSRIGLHQIRNQNFDVFNAETTHIFELSPEDWDLIFKFSGWKIVKSIRYTQYPKYSPLTLFRFLWRRFDFDGFYGVILQKDNTVLKKYADW
jgi:2-polyprenyl-3-methyl-5-hydroxy-6-metoxy-1,4-benzoquinol methylase